MAKTENEVFKECPLLPGGYMVSNFGRVKSISKRIIRSNNTVQNFKEKILKPVLTTNGYHAIHLRDSQGKKLVFPIHRLVGMLFIDNPGNKPVINHRDGVKINNHYSNLEWCTRSENLKHAYDNNLRSYNTLPAVEQRIKKRKQGKI